MSGIVFFRTKMLDKLRAFYTEILDCRVWLEQPDCCILQHGNLLFGFCTRDEIDQNALITFFYEDRISVDEMYDVMIETADGRPRYSEEYKIYQFFAKDPEGRPLEFQFFDHPLKPY